MPSNHLILCCPLRLLPSSNESVLCIIRWPKYWSFSFSISPFNEHSGLISFRIDCFDLLAVQGTLKSFLQHDRKHQFFGAQLSLWSNCYIHTMTTGKNIALIIWTFVCNVMSLLCNTLFRFILAFLPRSMCLLISWLQSPSTMILEPKNIK